MQYLSREIKTAAWKEIVADSVAIVLGIIYPFQTVVNCVNRQGVISGDIASGIMLLVLPARFLFLQAAGAVQSVRRG
jgi:hypothetical protein